MTLHHFASEILQVNCSTIRLRPIAQTSGRAIGGLWSLFLWGQNDAESGVIGFLGKNWIKIATFSLGRRTAGAEAFSVIQTDQPVPENVLQELLKNPAVTVARSVKFTN